MGINKQIKLLSKITKTQHDKSHANPSCKLTTPIFPEENIREKYMSLIFGIC